MKVSFMWSQTFGFHRTDYSDKVLSSIKTEVDKIWTFRAESDSFELTSKYSTLVVIIGDQVLWPIKSYFEDHFDWKTPDNLHSAQEQIKIAEQWITYSAFKFFSPALKLVFFWRFSEYFSAQKSKFQFRIFKLFFERKTRYFLLFIERAGFFFIVEG